MSNTITIELDQKDRALLDGLMGSISLLASVLANAQPKEVQEKIITEATAPATAEKPEQVPEYPIVENETPFDEPAPAEPAAEPERPAYTLDDIQALVVKLAAPATGKKDQVRAIVKEYAERVGLIQEKDFDAVMAKLTALDKEG